MAFVSGVGGGWVSRYVVATPLRVVDRGDDASEEEEFFNGLS